MMFLRHALALPVLMLVFATPLSLAQQNPPSGAKLYENAVTVAKQQATPAGAQILPLDEKEALKISQNAIGKQLGEYTFVNSNGRQVRLSDYRGKPLVIDMIYTHCPFVCATKTRNLDALKLSREALGADSFNVLTIGFDTENDTPEAMGSFASRVDAKIERWDFVSTDADTIKRLSQDLGFVFTPSPRGGFDHITQTTFVDAKGRIYQQIYGDDFDNKTLLEPLKNMIYDLRGKEPGLTGLSHRVRLFCTVYDAATGKYRVDYSYFYGIGLGVLVSMLIIWWIISEYRRSPGRSRPHQYPAP